MGEEESGTMEAVGREDGHEHGGWLVTDGKRRKTKQARMGI